MKKRIVTVALVVALLATCFGGTLAYLKDSEAQTNTFTTGNVLISLDEQKIGSEDRTTETQDYKLFPGMTVTKDPTITVDAKSENAWVAAKVTVSAEAVGEKDLLDLIGIPDTELIDINQVADGGLLEKASAAVSNWNGLSLVHETDDCFIYQAPDTNTWTLYIFMKNAQVKNDKIVLFEKLTIPTAWDNAEMDVVDTLEINVQAFAVQVNGFADCFTAMTTAFAEQFPLK